MRYSMVLLLKGKHFGEYQEETVGQGGSITGLQSSRLKLYPSATSRLYMILSIPHSLLGLTGQSVK